MDALGIKITRAGLFNSCWCCLNTSLNRRRARARTTALPNLRLVITPNCEQPSGGNTSQLTMIEPEDIRRPCNLSRAKTHASFNRFLAGNVKRAREVPDMAASQ